MKQTHRALSTGFIIALLIPLVALSHAALSNPATMKTFLNLEKRLKPRAHPKTNATESANKHILVFVSFSMPAPSLKAWLQQAHAHHASVLIRGLVDNSLKKTLIALTPFLSNAPGGIQIDPMAFKDYHIDRVPAVVITDDSNKYVFDVVFGDVPLSSALHALAANRAAKLYQGSDPKKNRVMKE